MNEDGQHKHGREEEGRGNETRDDDRLWLLLGRAPRPAPGPYFARRVLREVALHERDAAPGSRGVETLPPGSWRGWLAGLRRALLLAVAPLAALLLLFLGLRLDEGRRAVRPAPSGTEAPANLAATGETSAPDAVAPSAVATAAPEPPAMTLAAALDAAPDDFSAQDVEVVADLDTLLKREESRLWTEDTARF